MLALHKMGNYTLILLDKIGIVHFAKCWFRGGIAVGLRSLVFSLYIIPLCF
jgi:hypothetical protein